MSTNKQLHETKWIEESDGVHEREMTNRGEFGVGPNNNMNISMQVQLLAALETTQMLT